MGVLPSVVKKVPSQFEPASAQVSATLRELPKVPPAGEAVVTGASVSMVYVSLRTADALPTASTARKRSVPEVLTATGVV